MTVDSLDTAIMIQRAHEQGRDAGLAHGIELGVMQGYDLCLARMAQIARAESNLMAHHTNELIPRADRSAPSGALRRPPRAVHCADPAGSADDHQRHDHPRGLAARASGLPAVACGPDRVLVRARHRAGAQR